MNLSQSKSVRMASSLQSANIGGIQSLFKQEIKEEIKKEIEAVKHKSCDGNVDNKNIKTEMGRDGIIYIASGDLDYNAQRGSYSEKKDSIDLLYDELSVPNELQDVGSDYSSLSSEMPKDASSLVSSMSDHHTFLLRNQTLHEIDVSTLKHTQSYGAPEFHNTFYTDLVNVTAANDQLIKHHKDVHGLLEDEDLNHSFLIEKQALKHKFKCDLCQSSFFELTLLEKHLLECHLKLFKCFLCSQTFTKKDNLRKHRQLSLCFKSSENSLLRFESKKKHAPPLINLHSRTARRTTDIATLFWLKQT